MNKFADLVDNEKVGDLDPSDLIAHARHALLEAAKDFQKSDDEYEVEYSKVLTESAMKLQETLELLESSWTRVEHPIKWAKLPLQLISYSYEII